MAFISKKRKMALLFGKTSLSGALDNIGIANSAKATFSPYERILTSFNVDSAMYEVKRLGDNATKEFYVNPDTNLIDGNAVATWCGGGDGVVNIVANQSNNSYPFYQAGADSTKPKIVDSGVFQEDGLKFVTADGRFLKCDNHAAIGITSYPICVFTDAKFDPNQQSWLYIKHAGDSNEAQFGCDIWSDTIEAGVKSYANYSIETITENITYKNLMRWHGTGAGEVKLYINGVVASTLGIHNTTVTDHPNFRLGCSSANAGGTVHASHFEGHLKKFILFDSDIYEYEEELRAM